MNLMLRLLGAVSLAVCASCISAAVVTSFDEIDYWVGQGENQAALVIDWDESTGTGQSLVWGYRWEESSTGRDMLRAIVAADSRLYAKVNAPFQQVFGLGYDRNTEEPFGISDGSIFGPNGIAITDENSADLATATDLQDEYGEGWYTKFWHYSSRPNGWQSAWESNQQGMASRMLSNGDIDGWTFATLFNFIAYPDPPEPAPSATLPGDFNADGFVDAIDYAYWRMHLVDPDAYSIWRSNYGRRLPTVNVAASQAPEPAAVGLLWWCVWTARPAVRSRQT